MTICFSIPFISWLAHLYIMPKLMVAVKDEAKLLCIECQIVRQLPGSIEMGIVSK